MMQAAKKAIYGCFISLMLISCDAKREYDSYIAIKDNAWSVSDSTKFRFNISDTIARKNLFINVRNNKNYPFSNLFLITQINFPDGKKIVDTLEYEMTDVKGQFLGKGFTDIKENKLFYKENVLFPTSGEYSVVINHAMRKNAEVKGIENLEGITEVGFRIEKIN